MVCPEILHVPLRDGQLLVGECLVPPRPKLCAIVSHAMMVNRRTVTRALAPALVGRGCATLAFDQRGHAESGPRTHEGARFGYDDLVEDVGAMIDAAQEHFPELPIALVGHSLFGHVALAHLARQGSAKVRAVVLLGCSVPSRARPLRIPIALWHALSRLNGRFPARTLRVGSDDEPLSYIEDFVRWSRTRDWSSRDGFSYQSALARIDIPVLAIAGQRDYFLTPPLEAARLVASIPRHELVVVDATHMGLVLSAKPAWSYTAEFLLRVCARP